MKFCESWVSKKKTRWNSSTFPLNYSIFFSLKSLCSCRSSAKGKGCSQSIVDEQSYGLRKSFLQREIRRDYLDEAISKQRFKADCNAVIRWRTRACWRLYSSLSNSQLRGCTNRRTACITADPCLNSELRSLDKSKDSDFPSDSSRQREVCGLALIAATDPTEHVYVTIRYGSHSCRGILTPAALLRCSVRFD